MVILFENGTQIKKINLEIIEIQTGTVLSEEDIQRFSDQYGRE